MYTHISYKFAIIFIVYIYREGGGKGGPDGEEIVDCKFSNSSLFRPPPMSIYAYSDPLWGRG